MATGDKEYLKKIQEYKENTKNYHIQKEEKEEEEKHLPPAPSPPPKKSIAEIQRENAKRIISETPWVKKSLKAVEENKRSKRREKILAAVRESRAQIRLQKSSSFYEKGVIIFWFIVIALLFLLLSGYRFGISFLFYSLLEKKEKTESMAQIRGPSKFYTEWALFFVISEMIIFLTSVKYVWNDILLFPMLKDIPNVFVRHFVGGALGSTILVFFIGIFGGYMFTDYFSSNGGPVSSTLQPEHVKCYLVLLSVFFFALLGGYNKIVSSTYMQRKRVFYPARNGVVSKSDTPRSKVPVFILIFGIVLIEFISLVYFYNDISVGTVLNHLKQKTF